MLFLLFFPDRCRTSGTQVTLPTFHRVITLRVRFRSRVLDNVRYLTSLTRPMTTITLYRLSGLKASVFRRSFSLLFTRGVRCVIRCIRRCIMVTTRPCRLVYQCYTRSMAMRVHLSLINCARGIDGLINVNNEVVIKRGVSVGHRLARREPRTSNGTQRQARKYRCRHLNVKVLIREYVSALLVACFVVFLRGHVPRPVFRAIVCSTVERGTAPDGVEEGTWHIRAINVLVNRYLRFDFTCFRQLRSCSVVSVQLKMIRSPNSMRPNVCPGRMFYRSSRCGLLLKVTTFLYYRRRMSPNGLLSRSCLVSKVRSGPNGTRDSRSVTCNGEGGS